MLEAETKRAQERFTNFLSKRGLRLTSQRRAILESAFSTVQHFTAEELLTWSRQRDKSVSRATVYRTLPLLSECGLLREMDFGKNYKFYDPNYAERPHHNHIICEDCQKIIEFESEKLERLENQICKDLGFTVQTHRLQISGTCDAFRRGGYCERKNSN